ncbi:MAG TPA: hypothetical protein VH062_05655 [Polyangiaceae bacterium]|jgi:hypothetical protein|nr:hypothetical protein [Polyangiaceae bacterium]
MRPQGWTRAHAARPGRIRFVALAAFFHAVVAHADPSAADIASARRLFSEASALRQSGQWSEAAAKLREAIAIKETPGLRFHLAHCEEQVGHLLEARDDYDRSDALIRGGAAAPDVASMLEPARVALRERIPTLVVRAPADARAVGLTIDGEMIATEQLGSPVQLDPGDHTIIVSAASRVPFRLELSLKEGEDRVVEAQLAPSATSAPAPTPRAGVAAPRQDTAQSAEKRGFGLRESILVAEGVVTLAGAGLGVAFLLQTNSKSDEISSLNASIQRGVNCTNPPTMDTAVACGKLRQAVIDRNDDRVFAITGLVVAGVGAASLVTTWLVWPSPHAKDVAHVRIIPTIGGAVVRGTF